MQSHPEIILKILKNIPNPDNPPGIIEPSAISVDRFSETITLGVTRTWSETFSGRLSKTLRFTVNSLVSQITATTLRARRAKLL